MRTRDVMTTPARACGPDSDLAAVAKMMWDFDCGFVPVVDASGTVAGVVTDRDICVAAATRRLPPEQIHAVQAMTRDVHVCSPDDSVSDVLATMKQFKVRRLPVIDAQGQLQGVVSLNDIVLVSAQKRQPAATEIVSTLAAICAHRPVEAAVA